MSIKPLDTFCYVLLKPCILFLLLFNSSFIQAQEEKKKLVIRPTLALQLWTTYTDNQELYDAANQRYEVADNRLNFELHRSRLGIKGSYGKRWVYDMTTSLDFVGRDVLAGTIGGNNNSASPRFRVWNALVQYKTLQSEALYLTFGYQVIQVSRESISSPYGVSSFEKAWSQNYIRRHIVGVGPGRVTGLTIGGFMKSTKDVAFNYDIGIYNPSYTDLGGNSTGVQHAILLTGRIGIHLGDAEHSKYSRGHKFNFKGNRNGVTLSTSGSYSGGTDLWDDNSSIGIDILANYSFFNLAGEWMRLKRTLRAIESTANTGFLKLGYYKPLSNGKGLEPVITYVFFSGAMTEAEQEDASALGVFFGEDDYWELTLNYHLTPKIRLSISYTDRNGDAGASAPTLVNNNYFQQGGAGPIRRGNYLGLGLFFSI